MATADTQPQDQSMMMLVCDLPNPSVLQSNPKDVAKIRRSIRGSRGYAPAEGDEPITILRRAGKPDTLINGNHRTEALKTAGGFADTLVPVLITYRTPSWYPSYL